MSKPLFIAFASATSLTSSFTAHPALHPRQNKCARRPRTTRRTTPCLAVGASQSAQPPRDDSSVEKRATDHSAGAPFNPAPEEPPRPAAQASSNETPFARLAQPELTVDPVKSVPASLVDASGVLQIDDGSFGPSTAVAVPRRLVKRRSRRVARVDLASLRRQLAAGFDTGAGASLLLSGLFCVWYWANTLFNVYNKQVLKVFPYPLTCTVVQFAVAGAFMAGLWLARVKEAPKVNRFLMRYSAPLAVLHAAGFLLTNMSLGKVSVAFTHTVKSTEPFFSVALTPSILGDVPTWGILGSLFPIVAGVVLASATDVSFNWIGFFAAVGSNLAMQSRNVLSKKLMDSGIGTEGRVDKDGEVVEVSKEEEETLNSLDNVNLFSMMSILAFFLLVPVCFFWEGIPLVGATVAPAVTGMSTQRLYKMLFIGGLCRCVDVLSSYMILRRVSPVTHSVGNCVKRAVVIVVSIFFFKTRMTALSIAGTCLALFGVLLYSLVVSACKQNSFGPDSPFCKPIYETELELTEGSGI